MKDIGADEKIYSFANVIFKETDSGTYCYIADEEIHAGDLAKVITDEGEKYTLVAYIDRTTADKAPYPFEKLKHIVGRVTKDEPEYGALYKKYIRRLPYPYGEDNDMSDAYEYEYDEDKFWEP